MLPQARLRKNEHSGCFHGQAMVGGLTRPDYGPKTGNQTHRGYVHVVCIVDWSPNQIQPYVLTYDFSPSKTKGKHSIYSINVVLFGI